MKKKTRTMASSTNGQGGFGVGSFAFINRDAQDPLKEPFVATSWAINDQCNLQCPHCILRHRRTSQGKLSLRENSLRERALFFALRELRQSQQLIALTSFAATEPTLTPNRLVKMATIAKDYSQTILMTNALALDQTLQARLAPVIDYLDVSMDNQAGGPKAILDQKGDPTPAWQNICTAAKGNHFKQVAIIITLTSQNCQGITETLESIAAEFCNHEVTASVSFYTGPPDDHLLLDKDQFLESIRQAAQHRYSRILICVPQIYEQFLPWVFKDFPQARNSLAYCSKSGIPSYQLREGGALLVLPGQSPSTKLLRIEYDGQVFLGCNHLLGNGDGDLSRLAIGDIYQEPLSEIIATLVN